MRAIQCCLKCRKLEEGNTGPGDKYVCTECWNAGWRVDAFGNITWRAGAPTSEQVTNAFRDLRALIDKAERTAS